MFPCKPDFTNGKYVVVVKEIDFIACVKVQMQLVNYDPNTSKS